MSNIDKSLLKVAAAVLAANPDMQSCGVTLNGQAFNKQEEAQRYMDKRKQKGEALRITREDCTAEIAEILGDAAAPAVEEKKDDSKEVKALYVDPTGKEFNTNAELRAEVKARVLKPVSNSNDNLVAALKEDDAAKAEAAAKADTAATGAEGDQTNDDQTQA